MVPLSLTSSGIMLFILSPPASTDATVITPESTGLTFLATMLCSPCMIAAEVTTGSTAIWGMPPWPPFPLTVILMSSTLAIMGPWMMPTVPVFRKA